MKANATIRKTLADEEAVSPVVATLLLVLVAAGAAIGFGVFMNGFQKDTQENVQSSPNVQVLRIGGSSTVYEFTKVAQPFFEAANPGITLDVQRGGSGAGRQAVSTQCDSIDVGSSSSPFKPEELQKWPDCNGDGVKDVGSELVIRKVATDGVAFAMLAGNTHCAAGHVPMLTKAQAYELYYKAANTGQGTIGPKKDGSAADVPANALTADVSTAVTWANLPTINTATFAVAAIGAGFCGGTGGGAGGTDVVRVFDRSDPGGTSEIATQKLLGKTQAQLEEQGITLVASQQGDGNQGVLTAVSQHANGNHALFFTSYGYASNNALKIAGFGDAAGDSTLIPTPANIKSEAYDGSRPILYAAVGSGPDVSDIRSPLARLYMEFVLQPHNNLDFAAGADFISIY